VSSLFSNSSNVNVMACVAFAGAAIVSAVNAQTLPDGDITPGTVAAAECNTPAPLTLTYVNGGTQAQALDLYLPTSGKPPYPTVIWIHGGAWVVGDKSDVGSAKRLACRGYAVASINYRLSGTAKFPAQIYDVKAAIRYLRANASTYNLDVSRFASFGSSAGGHLSSLATTSIGVADLEDLAQGNATTPSSLRGAVAWYGPSDFSRMDAQALAQGCGAGAATHGNPDSPESALLGCTVSSPACAAAVARANPATYVNASTPPMLFMHGTQDCVVANGQSSIMKAAMDTVGRPATNRNVIGAGHGGLAWDTPPVQDAVSAFLDIILARPAKNDLGGDRKSDIVYADASGAVGVSLMNGISTSASANILPAGSGWSVTQIADVDGDGKADLLIRNTDGRVALLIMNGTNVSSFTTLFGAGTGWSVTQAADLNADGRADLVVKNADGRIAVLIMNGATIVSNTQLTAAGSPYTPTHAGDFNGDGKADIVLKHSDGSAAILLMNGAAVTLAGPLLSAGSPWAVSQVADLNGDGKADIVVRNSDASAAILLMNGTSVATASFLLTPGSPYTVTQTADFNGDGKADILVKHTDGSVAILLMNGTAVSGAALLLTPGSPFSVVQVADYNGDGKSDVLLRAADGSGYVATLNGTTVLAVGNVWGAGTTQSVP
jgi:acetyl esterase/lipase/uncharacterized protein (DUF2141 family)